MDNKPKKFTRTEYEIVLNEMSPGEGSAKLIPPRFGHTNDNWVATCSVTLMGESDVEARRKAATKLRELANAIDPAM